MRPSVVITISVLLLAILGAAALQFLFLVPQGNGPDSVDEQSGPSAIVTLAE